MEQLKNLLNGLYGVVTLLASILGALTAVILAWRRLLDNVGRGRTSQGSPQAPSAVGAAPGAADTSRSPQPSDQRLPAVQRLALKMLILLTLSMFMDFMVWGLRFFRDTALLLIVGEESHDPLVTAVRNSIEFSAWLIYGIVFFVFAWDIRRELDRHPEIRDDILPRRGKNRGA